MMAEFKDSIRVQDPLVVSHREARTTDIDAWLRNLDLDVKAGAILDPIVYLSVTSHLACINDVLGKRVIGGEREAAQYRRRSVEASYVRHDTIQKLSVYCGVVCTLPEATGNALAVTQATARAITTALSKVQVGLSQYPELQVRSGLALHLHSITEAWSAGPEDGIEVPMTLACCVCGVELHHSNRRWRDGAGKYQVLVNVQGEIARGMPKTRLDHYHVPAGVVLDEDGYEVAG